MPIRAVDPASVFMKGLLEKFPAVGEVAGAFMQQPLTQAKTGETPLTFQDLFSVAQYMPQDPIGLTQMSPISLMAYLDKVNRAARMMNLAKTGGNLAWRRKQPPGPITSDEMYWSHVTEPEKFNKYADAMSTTDDLQRVQKDVDELIELGRSGKWPKMTLDEQERVLSGLGLRTDFNPRYDTSHVFQGEPQLRLKYPEHAAHEAGHILLAEKQADKPWTSPSGGAPSLWGEWRNLYESGLWNFPAFTHSDYWSSQAERYAELMALYMNRNAELKKIAPQLYDKIENLMDMHVPTASYYKKTAGVREPTFSAKANEFLRPELAGYRNRLIQDGKEKRHQSGRRASNYVLAGIEERYRKHKAELDALAEEHFPTLVGSNAFDLLSDDPNVFPTLYKKSVEWVKNHPPKDGDSPEVQYFHEMMTKKVPVWKSNMQGQDAARVEEQLGIFIRSQMYTHFGHKDVYF